MDKSGIELLARGVNKQQEDALLVDKTAERQQREDNKKMINRQFIDSMLLNSSLINTARSGLIDLSYLYSVLDVKINKTLSMQS